MKRRNFLFWFGLGGLWTYLQPVLATTKGKLLVTQTNSAEGFISVGTIGELKGKRPYFAGRISCGGCSGGNE